MRVIRISEEVWQAIAARGIFGETENDVLERIFDIEKPPEEPAVKAPVSPPRIIAQKRHQFATVKMSTEVRGKKLFVSFANGASDSWLLPDTSDKNAIRTVRDNAVEFAKLNGASYGQEQAVKKALTDAGYWLNK
jgi:hypothetical protein